MAHKSNLHSSATGDKKRSMLTQRRTQSLLSLYAELGHYCNPSPPPTLYFPHLVGSLLAACAATDSRGQNAVAPSNSLLTRVLVSSLFFVPASAVLHGLDCT